MAKTIIKKLLSNAQDLEIYLSVEGILGRAKQTRAAMARKFDVKPGVAESGYKRGKKLYEKGERPDAEVTQHENNVTAIKGDATVTVNELCIGTVFKTPKPQKINGEMQQQFTAYAFDGNDVLVNLDTEECVTIDRVELVDENRDISALYVALTHMAKFPDHRFTVDGKYFTITQEDLDQLTLDACIIDEACDIYSYTDLVDMNFTSIVRTELNVLRAELVPDEKQTKIELDKKVMDTNLSEVYDLPTIVNTTMALIVKDGTNHQIPSTHTNFDRVCQAIKDRQWDTAIELMSVKKTLENYSKGRISVDKGQVVFDDEPLEHIGFQKRIVSMMSEGDTDNLDKLVAFLDKLMDNPSNKIVTRVFDFMKFNEIEICEDGDIMVFKAVNSQYRDCHSNKIDNSVGAIVKMRRNRVNENDNQTCSYGLHVCALSYLPSYAGSNGVGNRILKCKLNPRDIVSVPTDYRDAKIRCCKYVVVEDVTKAYRAGKIEVDMEGIFSVE